MVKTNKKDLLMIALDKAIELYLATLETEAKSPWYVAWLRTRLRFFATYIEGVYGLGVDPHKIVELIVGQTLKRS